MRFTPQTMTLAAIGIADLVTTLLFIGAAGAGEANPLMAPLLQLGPIVFIQAKLLLLLAPLAVLEWARRYRPRFVHRAVNCGIAAYVVLYGAGIAHLNRKVDIAQLVTTGVSNRQLQEQRKMLGLSPGKDLRVLARAARPVKAYVYMPLEPAPIQRSISVRDFESVSLPLFDGRSPAVPVAKKPACEPAAPDTSVKTESSLRFSAATASGKSTDSPLSTRSVPAPSAL